MAALVITCARLIPAPAERIVALLANPAEHRRIDGSGQVRATRGTPNRLAFGSTFAVDVHHVMRYPV